MPPRRGALVQVYAEAERINRANFRDNLALEDIAEEIMIQAAQGPGFEADPLEARSAPPDVLPMGPAEINKISQRISAEFEAFDQFLAKNISPPPV